MPDTHKTTPKPNKWNNLILHLHPKLVPEKALSYTLTFGLGGMSALLFVLLALTGMLLRFIYVPTPDAAYNSILQIKNEVLFGNLIRNIHHWSATLLVLISFLHMLRVLFTGAYNQKRGSNWTIGVIMLLLVFFSSFSGYLLPWDQLAYWAVTVVTGMLLYIPLIGEYINNAILHGSEVGAPTLLLFYTMHTGILPLAMVILMSFHFWKVRKAGGVVIPKELENIKTKKVPVIPNLVVREFVVAISLLAFILLLATLFEAPFGKPANPSITPNPTKAPWYFMGFQELILHFHPFVAVVLLPVSILTLLFYLPKIKNVDPVKGFWFLSPLGIKLTKYSSISAVVLSITFIVLDEYIFSMIPIFKYGFLALALFIIFIYLASRWIRIKLQANKAELIQTISVFLIVSFIVFTLTGILFRGEGMHLSFF